LRRFQQWIVYALESAVIALIFGFLRILPVDWASGIGGFLGRNLGPRFPVSKVGEQNLRAAFPDKSEAEIQRLVRSSWDNLLRVFTEYSQLDRLWDRKPTIVDSGTDARMDRPVEVHSRIDFADGERFYEMLKSGKPRILFTGHCGNWEVLPVVAARYGMPVAVIFRPPNSPYARQLVEKVRSRSMGRLVPTNTMGTAAIAAASLGRGESLGLLIDQYFGKGIDLPFFGRMARTAPTLAKIAQHFDCPITGAVVERLDGAHFRLHLLPDVETPRTPQGKVDVPALMAVVTSRLEDWVRAHPDQYLWFHRRWR
jgi:KDO2-lipid IV(A) lauroyltransferase